MLEAIRYVDLVIPENDWSQNIRTSKGTKSMLFAWGGRLEGDRRFEALKDTCEVVYLDRTEGISTTEVKSKLKG